LKGVGIAFRIHANDSNGRYPMSEEFKDPAVRESVIGGQTFRAFQVMSNELSVPMTVICPADTRRAAEDWSSFTNGNLSYFLGLDAVDARPNMALSGDRNLARHGKLLSGVISLGTNSTVTWTEGMHRSAGNVGLADGSVQQFTTHLLHRQLANSGDRTNRVVFPQ
jgi:hypothetical protein